MTSAAINPKGPRVTPKAGGAAAWADAYLGSTVGQKILVAIAGLSLAVFVIFHMIGNLKMFSGPESINKYAYFLKHDLGALIWLARGGLLGAFLLHVILTLRLKMRAAAARPVPYHHRQYAQATFASTSMLWTGLVIFAFVLYHLAHFTFGMAHETDGGLNYLSLGWDTQTRTTALMDPAKPWIIHNVYAMVVSGFSTPYIVGIYLFAQVVLFIHLSHGIQSALNTLGLVSKRFSGAAKLFGISLAGFIFLGNTAIVAAVMTGYVK